MSTTFPCFSISLPPPHLTLLFLVGFFLEPLIHFLVFLTDAILFHVAKPLDHFPALQGLSEASQLEPVYQWSKWRAVGIGVSLREDHFTAGALAWWGDSFSDRSDLCCEVGAWAWAVGIAWDDGLAPLLHRKECCRLNMQKASFCGTCSIAWFI